MDWRWTARRIVISAFLLFHLSATIIWVMPNCPIRQAAIGSVSYYMMPLGLWQFWTMFAPDPASDSLELEAEVVDAKGIQGLFAFPRSADYGTWEGMLHFRHSKYAANLTLAEFEQPKLSAARHAVRQFALPSDAYPVEVRLVYQVRRAQAPGKIVDLMVPKQRVELTSFRFETPAEVNP